MRAKRATFTYWVDKSSLKMPKMVHFGEFLKSWNLLSNSVTRFVNFKRSTFGEKCQKKIKCDILGPFRRVFEKTCGQKVLPDRSILIGQKVVNITSEASYIYNLSGQKLIKNTENGHFWRVFENLSRLWKSVTRQVHFGEFWNPESCGQIVLPDRSLFIGQKLTKNATFWVIFKHCDTVVPKLCFYFF